MWVGLYYEIMPTRCPIQPPFAFFKVLLSVMTVYIHTAYGYTPLPGHYMSVTLSYLQISSSPIGTGIPGRPRGVDVTVLLIWHFIFTAPQWGRSVQKSPDPKTFRGLFHWQYCSWTIIQKSEIGTCMQLFVIHGSGSHFCCCECSVPCSR